MKHKSTTHIDITTILGTINALSLLNNKNNNNSVSIHNLYTLSQFLESIIFYDNVLYECDTHKNYDPYLDTIKRSSLFEHIGSGQKVIVGHNPPSKSDEIISDSYSWALDKSGIVDKNIIKKATIIRKDIYQCVEDNYGVKDFKNPFIEDELASLKKTSSSSKLCKINVCISKIGITGLHTLSRVYLLHDWLSDTKITYSPHFTRANITSFLLNDQNKTKKFNKWASEKIQSSKENFLESIDIPYKDNVFKFSPIFTTCLVGAKYPLDVLNNALILRDKAKELRRLLSKLENSKMDDNKITVSLRESLLNQLESISTSNNNNNSFSLSAGIGYSLYTGISCHINIHKLLTKKHKKSNLAFFSDIYNTSKSIYNEMQLIEKIFGTVSY